MKNPRSMLAVSAPCGCIAETGMWSRDEVESDLADLGVKADWAEYTLERVFIESDVDTKSLIKMLDLVPAPKRSEVEFTCPKCGGKISVVIW